MKTLRIATVLTASGIPIIVGRYLLSTGAGYTIGPLTCGQDLGMVMTGTAMMTVGGLLLGMEIASAINNGICKIVHDFNVRQKKEINRDMEYANKATAKVAVTVPVNSIPPNAIPVG